jgi:hypothetical protein
MRNEIIAIVCVFLLLQTGIALAATDVVYSIQIKYSSGQLSLDKVGLVEGTAPDRTVQPEDGYLVKVVTSTNQVLYSFKFNIPITVSGGAPPKEWFNETTGEQIIFPTNETVPQITKTTFNLIVPYFSNANSVDIYDPTGKLALSVDVSKFVSPSGLPSEIIIIAVIVIAAGAGIFFFRKKLFKKQKKRNKKH